MTTAAHTATRAARVAQKKEQADARYAGAFQIGETALEGKGHSADLLLYYKHLVARAFPTGSFVATQGELAAAMGKDPRTIRTWDGHLQAAGLIWSTKVGRCYRRYVSHFVPEPVAGDEPEAAAPTRAELIARSHTLAQEGKLLDAIMLLQQAKLLPETSPESVEETAPEPADSAFFSADIPEGSIRINRIDPSDSTVKENQESDQGGATPPYPPGGGDALPPGIPDTPATQLLHAVGVEDPQSLRALASREPRDIERAIDAARGWHEPVRCFPGLVTTLALKGIWPGREQAPRPRAAPPPAQLAPTAHQALWRDVLAALRAQLPPGEYATWLAPSALLYHDTDVAIVGVPNVFVRDQVRHRYSTLLAEALGRALSRPMRVEVEIAGGPP